MEPTNFDKFGSEEPTPPLPYNIQIVTSPYNSGPSTSNSQPPWDLFGPATMGGNATTKDHGLNSDLIVVPYRGPIDPFLRYRHGYTAGSNPYRPKAGNQDISKVAGSNPDDPKAMTKDTAELAGSNPDHSQPSKRKRDTQLVDASKKPKIQSARSQPAMRLIEHRPLFPLASTNHHGRGYKIPPGGRPTPSDFFNQGFRMLNGWWECDDLPEYTMLSDYHVGVLVKNNLVTQEITMNHQGDFTMNKDIRKDRKLCGRASKYKKGKKWYYTRLSGILLTGDEEVEEKHRIAPVGQEKLVLCTIQHDDPPTDAQCCPTALPPPLPTPAASVAETNEDSHDGDNDDNHGENKHGDDEKKEDHRGGDKDNHGGDTEEPMPLEVIPPLVGSISADTDVEQPQTSEPLMQPTPDQTETTAGTKWCDFSASRPYTYPDRPPITRLRMELEDDV